jgi:diguanylate cyclase (GGDEF)-like protein
LFFVLPAITALAAGGFVVQRVVVGEIARRAVASLAPALDATVALYNDRAEALDSRVRASLGLTEFAELLRDGDRSEVSVFLRQKLRDAENLDFIIAYDAEGKQLAYEHLDGEFVPGVEEPSLEEVLASTGGVGARFNRTAEIPVRVSGRGQVGSVIGGFWVDRGLLTGASQANVNLSLVADGRVFASTADLAGPEQIDLSFEGTFQAELDGAAEAEARALEGDRSIMASTPTEPVDALSRRVLMSMLGLLLLALVGMTLLAHLLARLVTQPLEELAEGAKAIAENRFEHRIVTPSNDEVGQLAGAFNDMSDRLKDTITQLQSSRDQLQRTVRRAGETMRSTHDMHQMLDSILNTAVDAVQADAGALWRFTPTRKELYIATSVSLDSGSLERVQVGQGIVGHVAERAARLLLPASEAGPRPAAGEPGAPVVLALPLYSRDRVTGVLAIYRDDIDKPFADEDLDTVVFLAEQGGAAIENVQLHEETKRLSLTDGLTGIWNRRFFTMQFRQVLATATRFERPFSVLMMDLDFFKQVNDTYGHQRGDAILIEFAQRVTGAVREVDTFARYGGEEFICLLSETDQSGALITAGKICELIRNEPFESAGEGPISLSVSIGVASHPEHGDSFKTLVEAADRALYSAKESGRDKVVVANPPPASQLKLAT